jgi:uncharacterized protein (TIGR03118 family)
MRASRQSTSQAPIRSRRWSAVVAAALATLVAAALPAVAASHSRHHSRGLDGFHQRNLVGDTPGAAELTDPNLVNAWGLAFGPATPAWVADNGTDVATLYSGATAMTHAASIVPLVVNIPGGAPTGLVFNGGTGFVVHDGTASGPARFLFSSEAGVISGWNPGVPAGTTPSTQAQVAATVSGAIYKGLAIADTNKGPRLYATDFHNARVDVWDDTFAPAGRPGGFADRKLPNGFGPFGIQTVADKFVVVTYAKQDAAAEDEVAGPGLGFVDVYDTAGKLLRRFAAGRPLNAPWGIALAPKGFGRASGDLLIGNFGDGRINAFDPRNGRFEGALRDKHGSEIAIDGLWALEFGNGTIGTPQTLLFTAGPGDEQHGLFGAITAGGHR